MQEGWGGERVEQRVGCSQARASPDPGLGWAPVEVPHTSEKNTQTHTQVEFPASYV